MVLQLVSRRYERGSVICTSNEAFGEWGSVYGEPALWRRVEPLPPPR